jgi:peptide/nickel transport system permease protein
MRVTRPQPNTSRRRRALRWWETPGLAEVRRPQSFWRRLRRSRTGFASLIVVVLLLAAALLGPLLYPISPALTDFGHINAAPSLAHPLGTDRLGHDTLARLIAGLRVSLLVAGVVEAINITLGGVLGLLAGYFGGWVDLVISRVADLLFAFPGLLLAILVAAVFGQWVTEHYGSTARLVLVAASISLVSWPLMARYVRGQTLSLRERDFVLAARAMGQSELGILRHHLLPNVAGLVITAATLDVVSAIVGEATLSLLGLGIQSPATSIGKMIVEATPQISQNALLVLAPAATLALLVLAFSFLGDGLRQAFDPDGR